MDVGIIAFDIAPISLIDRIIPSVGKDKVPSDRLSTTPTSPTAKARPERMATANANKQNPKNNTLPPVGDASFDNIVKDI